MANEFQTLWFFLVGTALFVFTALDGFDLGVGMINPFWTKKAGNRVLAINSIWPVWDGNELWGIIGGGALFGIFPVVFSTILTGFYPFVVLLLACIMFRPISFEIWFHDTKNRGLWQGVFATASFGISFLVGVVVGDTVGGIQLAADGSYAGGLFALLTPMGIATGLLFVTSFMTHGLSWLMVKLPDEAVAEAKSTHSRVWTLNLVVLAAWLILLFTTVGDSTAHPVVFVFAALAIGAQVCGRLGVGKISPILVLLLSAVGIGAIWAAIGGTQFPVLIRSTDPATTLTVVNAAGAPSTLTFLGIAAPIAIVLGVGYNVIVYRIFKGKVHSSTASY